MDLAKARKVVLEIAAKLKAQGDPTRAREQERYMKHVVRCHGLRMKDVDEFFKTESLLCRGQEETEDGGALALLLLQSEYQEEKELGIRLWKLGDEELRASVFEKGLVTGWAICDSACSRILREGCKKDSGWRERVSRWGTGATNLWTVRASCVAFICTLNDEVCRTAALVAADYAISNSPFKQERFVQLGIGWLVREIGVVDAGQANHFIRQHLGLFSAEGLRYATEKLSPTERDIWRGDWKQLNGAPKGDGKRRKTE